MLTTRKIDFKRERDFSEKINATFEFIRTNIRLLTKVVLLVMVPLLAVGVGVGTYLKMTLEAYRDEGMFSSGANFMNEFGVIAVGLGVYYMIVVALMITVVTSFVQLYVELPAGSFDAREILQRTRENALRGIVGLIMSTVIMSLLTGGIVMLVIGVSRGLGMLFLLLLYPMIILMEAVIISIIERMNYFRAIGRSFYLLKNNWWATFALLIIVGLIWMSLSFVLYIPATILSVAMATTSLENPDAFTYNIIYIAVSALGAIISILPYTILIILLCFQYFNLLEEKEAPGLIDRIAMIGLRMEEDEDF